jgi:hypothetical protein
MDNTLKVLTNFELSRLSRMAGKSDLQDITLMSHLTSTLSTTSNLHAKEKNEIEPMTPPSPLHKPECNIKPHHRTKN